MYWWWNWRWHKWWLHELYAPVSNNAVEDFSSKPSEADFDVAIDKPLKQEVSLKFKTKNCPVNEVEQTMTYSDEQEKVSITRTTTLYSKKMKYEGKVLHLFWGAQQYLGLEERRYPEIGKSKPNIAQE